MRLEGPLNLRHRRFASDRRHIALIEVAKRGRRGLAGDLPVGIWEIGNTASASFTPTPDDVTDYMGYIQSTLSGRLNSGLPVGSSTWYNGPADASQTGGNEIAGTDPCSLAATDILQYQILWDGVNGVSPY